MHIRMNTKYDQSLREIFSKQSPPSSSGPALRSSSSHVREQSLLHSGIGLSLSAFPSPCQSIYSLTLARFFDKKIKAQIPQVSRTIC